MTEDMKNSAGPPKSAEMSRAAFDATMRRALQVPPPSKTPSGKKSKAQTSKKSAPKKTK